MVFRFELVSHEGLSREEHDQRMGDAIAAHEPDYVVLAKYMRVLTPEFVARFPNKIIKYPPFVFAGVYRRPVPIIRPMSAA
ncbi:formyltetrahydrofolate deformylase [Klebsiella pneumoniae subsp. ozaenae]|uniref:Formyltetrahydrofolate deformylase n=1 Tax=Klebsiella pneumoniae subsp. ozaenae TaxID=574 RepID=A0A377ZH08_KLEPO|nr:formyltetrahydrofolate deformylase [Klebsiella pneumoniae subsp. ozaenae]